MFGESDDTIVTPARTINSPAAEPSESAAAGGNDASSENIDPTSLPPELQGIYKSLESGFTKKFQALAEERKKLESGDSTLKQQAEAFQRLTSDPEYRRAYLAALDAENPQAAANPSPWDGIKPAEIFDEKTHQGIQAASYEIVKQVLTPILQQFDQYRRIIDGLQTKHQSSEWDTLASKYQNAGEFRDAALSLRQKAPSLSLEQALHAVASGGLKAPAEAKPAQAGQSLTDKRQATMFPSGQTSTGGRPTTGKIDLLKAFRADLAKSGISF